MAASKSRKTDVGAGQAGINAAPTKAHRALQPIIGRWITHGFTSARDSEPAVEIIASDVYEWIPGGFFMLHSAYGVIDGTPVGGTEIIGADKRAKAYRTWFFDAQGNVEEQKLEVAGRRWTWTGDKTRCKAVLSKDGRTMIANHERTLDGKSWIPTMEVTLARA